MPAVYDSEELDQKEKNPYSTSTSSGNATYSSDPESSEQSFYTPSSNSSSTKKGGRIKLFGSRRRKIIFGATGAGTIGGLVLFFTIASGPFQFIHIAQQLQQFHFSHLDDAADGRTGKLFRWARTGDIGNTRLTYFESKYKNRIVSEMSDMGLDPKYNSTTRYLDGFTVDPSNEKSPYHGMTNEEIQTTMNDKFGTKVKVSQVNGIKGKVFVKAEGFFAAPKTNSLLVKEMHRSKIGSVLPRRVLGKYGYASYHPMKILDRKTNESIAKLYDGWRQKRQDRLKKGVGESSVDATKAEEKDSEGKKNPIPGEETDLSSDKVKGTLKAIQVSKSFRLAGGTAAAVGVVCVAKTVNDNIPEIRYYQVIVPLMRMGMDAVTVGSQIMAGQDVDPQEVNFLAKSFNDVNAKGEVVSSWNQAKSFQAEEGQPGGIDINSGTKDLITQGSPSWLSWTDSPGMDSLCSGTGQAITGVVSFAVGVLSGGTVSTMGSIVAGALAGPFVIDKLSHVLAGESVDVLAKGAEWGNDINYGTRLAANSSALSGGGAALSSGQVAQLDAQQEAENKADFQAKNLVSRLLDPYDYRTPVAKFIDSSGSGISTPVAKIKTMFNFSNVFPGFMRSLTPKVLSAPAHYDYGFPEYGFSEQDLSNRLVEDPYVNAKEVASLLDGPSGSSYIKKVNDCFGVELAKGDQGWDANPSEDPVDPYDSSSYNNNDCLSSSDPNWLRVRFFIFDTQTMKGYACYEGDDDSCSDLGFESTPEATATDTTPPASSNARQLAQQILSNPKINTSGRLVLEDLQATANGKAGSSGAPLSAAILRLIATVGQSHSLTITALESGGTGHAENSQHYSGDAVDFGIIDGKLLSGRDPGSLIIINIATKTLPKGSGFGQSSCGGQINLPPGFTQFPDTCNHLHVQVPDGTQ